MILVGLCTLAGWVIYANYEKCDLRSNGQVQSNDQVGPLISPRGHMILKRRFMDVEATSHQRCFNVMCWLGLSIRHLLSWSSAKEISLDIMLLHRALTSQAVLLMLFLKRLEVTYDGRYIDILTRVLQLISFLDFRYWHISW